MDDVITEDIFGNQYRRCYVVNEYGIAVCQGWTIASQKKYYTYTVADNTNYGINHNKSHLYQRVCLNDPFDGLNWDDIFGDDEPTQPGTQPQCPSKSSCPSKDCGECTQSTSKKREKIVENENRDSCIRCGYPTKTTWIEGREIHFCPKCE